MESKHEELRIVIRDYAIVDHEVEAMQERFARLLASVYGFAGSKDREGYTVAFEELCRVSRRIIWEFIRAGSCQEEQVSRVLKTFESCHPVCIESFGSDRPEIGDFIEAISTRSNRLRAALEDRQVEEFAAVG